MEEIKTFIAYSLFAFCILAVCLWAITQEYKYGGSTEEEVVATQDSLDLDWEDFIKALIWVESKGDSKAVGSNNDIGVLQITPIVIKDVNRILGCEVYALEDRLDSLKSVEMFNIIQDHYNPQRDYNLALKIWNSKAPLSYHRKVMDKFNEIKYGSNR